MSSESNRDPSPGTMTDSPPPRSPALKSEDADKKQSHVRTIYRWIINMENRILFVGFLITLSFSFTQVPLFYVFHLMMCDVYYDDHPPFQGPGQRCSRDEIAAGTATQYSILGMSTTLFGTVNLFVAGWTVKKFGPRTALLVQILVPAIRVLAQIAGVLAGRMKGMAIIQSTQVITIVGGPAGYILIVNIIAGELVSANRRTAVFGKLQGAIMLGQGIGYLTGGMIGDAIDITAPFLVAFTFFLIASVFARCTLPYISPDSMSDSKTRPGQDGVSGFLAPLKILAPQRLRLADGRVRKHYGVIMLCGGIFVGVLATGYAPLLIQMYATAAFDFSQSDNGWLMAEFAFMRSAFLIFLFPPIISFGRRRLAPSKAAASKSQPGATKSPAKRVFTKPATAKTPLLPPNSSQSVSYSSTSQATTAVNTPCDEASSPQKDDVLPALDLSAPPAAEAVESEETLLECTDLSASEDEEVRHVFDLVFLRWSLVVDGALTTIAAFATQRWHIYLAAFLLPLGSGSAPAAKGVITAMCAESSRADALNAVTLVENIARLATQGLFGFVFASLASEGRAYATFFCNAAVAVLGMLVLLLSRFPQDGAVVVDRDEVEEDGHE